MTIFSIFLWLAILGAIAMILLKPKKMFGFIYLGCLGVLILITFILAGIALSIPNYSKAVSDFVSNREKYTSIPAFEPYVK